MPTLYRDRTVTIDDAGILIASYYFPTRTPRRILWSELQSASLQTMSLWSGKWRLWGMGVLPYWFNWDASRLRKTFFIALETGEVIKPAITPDEPEVAMAIINMRLHRTAEMPSAHQ